MFIAFALSLIALAMGATLILGAKKNAELHTGGCKFFGYIISILAIIMILFTGYISVTRAYMVGARSGSHMAKVQKMIKK